MVTGACVMGTHVMGTHVTGTHVRGMHMTGPHVMGVRGDGSAWTDLCSEPGTRNTGQTCSGRGSSPRNSPNANRMRWGSELWVSLASPWLWRMVFRDPDPSLFLA